MPIVLQKAVHHILHRDHLRPALEAHRIRQRQQLLAATPAPAMIIAPDQRRSKLIFVGT